MGGAWGPVMGTTTSAWMPMDEGLTRLVASLPTDEAEFKGETWFPFLLLHASKARLLSLAASLPCLLMFLRAAACDHVHLQTCY